MKGVRCCGLENEGAVVVGLEEKDESEAEAEAEGRVLVGRWGPVVERVEYDQGVAREVRLALMSASLASNRRARR